MSGLETLKRASEIERSYKRGIISEAEYIDILNRLWKNRNKYN